MSCNQGTPNINKTFVIEPLSITGGSPTLSACTALYTNEIISCSGDTTISLGTGVIYVNNNFYVNGNLSGDTISGNTFFSGGTNLLDIFSTHDFYITGGTLSNETLTLGRNDGASIQITGFTDTFTTGGTVSGTQLVFDTTEVLSAYTIDLSGLVVSDIYVTGSTFNQNTRTLSVDRNDGISISVSGFSDDFTTGATYSNGFVYFDRNDSLSAYTVDLTPLIDDTNTFVTGGTLNGDTLELNRNDNVKININLTDIRFSGGSGNCISDFYVTNIHGCSPITINDELIVLSGLTINLPNNDNTLTQIISRDSSTGELKYRDVQSIISAATSSDVFVTGMTFSSNELTLSRNDNATISTTISNFSGLTVSGNLTVGTLSATTLSAGNINTSTINTNVLSATTISGGTYYGDGSNLSGIDNYYTTGSTLFGTTLTFNRNDSLSAYTVDLSSLATDIDTFITGFTYNPLNNQLVISEKDKVSLSVNLNAFTNISITGLTVSDNAIFNNDITIKGNALVEGNVTILGTATTINSEVVLINDNIITLNSNATGNTLPFPINSGIEALRNSGTTSQFIWNENNKQWEAGLSGSTAKVILSTDGLSDLANTAHTHTISEVINLQSTLNNKLGLSGGTLTGALYGPLISATTISGGTLYGDGSNLSGILNTFITGGTYDGISTVTYTNNQGSTFIVTGITDYYTTGATLVGNQLYFNRIDGLSAYTVDLSPILGVWGTGSAGSFSIKANNDTLVDATANYAVAEGNNTLASGIASHSEGKNTVADGDCSHAEGDGTVASGNTSHAEGSGTVSKGLSSHAEGSTTLAEGVASHAEGNQTTASGDYSHSEGWSTIASGRGAHAEGYETIASGDYSHTGGANDLFFSGIIKASGFAAFNHSFSNISEPLYGAVGNYSAILGGANANVLSGATASGLFVGSGNTINSNVINSAIIGGTNIVATTNNTVYVPNLNINYTPSTDNSLINILVRDSNGDIKTRTVTSLFTGATSVTGFTYDSANTFTIANSDGSTYSANISNITGITTSGDILVDTDNTVNLGTPIRRFRDVNTISGTSTYWTSTNVVVTPNLDLGLDSLSNSRIITADNSIIQNDFLNGGNY